MTTEKNLKKKEGLSRRDFLKVALGVIGTVALGGNLAGCKNEKDLSNLETIDLEVKGIAIDPHNSPKVRSYPTTSSMAGETTFIGSINTKSPSLDYSNSVTIEDEIELRDQKTEFEEHLRQYGLTVDVPNVQVYDDHFESDNFLSDKPRPQDGDNGLWIGIVPAEIPEEQRKHFPDKIFSDDYLNESVWISGSYARPIPNNNDTESKENIDSLYDGRYAAWSPEAEY